MIPPTQAMSSLSGSSGSGAVPSGARCAVHGDRPAEFTCTRCGNFACDQCKHPGENGTFFCSACTEHAYGDIPLERRAEIGLFPALFQTIVGVLFKPWEFFAQRPREESVLPAILFGTLVQIPGTLLNSLINAFTSEQQMAVLRDNPVLRGNPYFNSEIFEMATHPATQLAITLVTLLLFPLGLAMFAGMEWLALFAVGVRGASFRNILRSLAYLQATSLWMVALAPVSLVAILISPDLGGLVFFPYFLYWVIWLVIALWKTSRTELWRPVVAQGLIFMTCCCLPWMLLTMAIVAAVASAFPR